MTLPERFEPGRNRSAPERLKPVEFRLRAAVAELVDAQASGACVRKNVEVRLLSAAFPGRPACRAGFRPRADWCHNG